MTTPLKFVFFGGEPLAVPVLEKLQAAGLTPSLVVCNPDRRSGRGLELAPPPAKVWATAAGIEVFQPATYKDDTVKTKLTETEWDVFVVVAYNFILPEWLLAIPKHGVINVHPSLLPKLRGASPIRTAILENLPGEVGVSVILLDKEMDHGPILDQVQLPITSEHWPVSGPELDRTLADLGSELLAEVLPAWVAGELSPQEQDHAAATYCGRLQKSDSELQIDPHNLPASEAGRRAWHAINAFAGIGDTFFIHEGKRVKIKQAEFAGGKLRLLRVIPEGKKEIDFTDYLSSLSS